MLFDLIVHGKKDVNLGVTLPWHPRFLLNCDGYDLLPCDTIYKNQIR